MPNSYQPDLSAFVWERPGTLVHLTHDVQIHVVERGTRKPGTPTVVLLHGKLGSVYDYLLTPVVDLLAVNWHVLVIDRPGCGYSTVPAGFRLSLGQQAHLLACLFEHLNIHKPIIVGHSLGASLALTLVVQYPNLTSACVLLAPYAFPGSGPRHARIGNMLKLPFIGEPLLEVARPWYSCGFR
ncbi:MAG: alpha/beta hydrolase [Blastochloris sp.]|nr:alpha/beta hydrolase [Blastochloris sp.]